jgi:hypothetical protein
MLTNFKSLLFQSLVAGVTGITLLNPVTLHAQEHQRAHFGLVYPISTNGIRAAQISNTVSLHALAGVSAGEDGSAISGLATIIKGSQRGVVISGLCTLISGDASGVQISGLVNTAGSGNGAQVAGLVNTARNQDGVQVAGLTNIASGNATAQIAGLVNTAQTATVQIAGISNLSAKSSNVQIAGLVNTSANSNGQIAGLVNIAGKVKGVQIAGLVNIAAESDCPIGILNLVKNGEKQLGVTVDEAGNAVLALRTGGKRTYGILGAGMNMRMPDAPYTMEAGLGLHVPLSKALRLNFELSNTANTNFKEISYYKSSFRALLGLQLGRVELVAGPTFNYVNYISGQESYTSHSLWDFYGKESTNSLFIGGFAGVHIRI